VNIDRKVGLSLSRGYVSHVGLISKTWEPYILTAALGGFPRAEKTHLGFFQTTEALFNAIQSM